MKKKILLISLLCCLVSCTTIFTKSVDIISNLIVKDKKDLVYELSIKARKFEELYPRFFYTFKEYKYKNSLFYLYKNQDSDNLLLYVHGGGFLSHYLSNSHLRTVEKIYDNSKEKFEMIFLDLKGEHYPDQTNELDDLLDYVLTKYKKVIVIGDSSGGNVVLSTILRRKDEKKKLVSAVVVFSPWTDTSNNVDSRDRNFDVDIFFGKSIYPKTLSDNPYVRGENLKNPYVSPIYGDYKGFPKTYFQYGEDEMLADDSIIIYEKMKKANVDASIDGFPKMFHTFQLFNISEAKVALKKVASFVDGVYEK